MTQPTLAIFANFFIDNEERLQRMKDSFHSFKEVDPYQWLINIRGRFKRQATLFLQEELGEKLNLFNLQSRQGWIHDSKIIAKNIKSDYVFIWIEDHILVATPLYFKNCIIEMNKFNADQLMYSFYDSLCKEYSIIEPHKLGSYITLKKIDLDAMLKIKDQNIKKSHYFDSNDDFIINCLASIISKSFFTKILMSPKPYLKRWPKHTPFDFEKKSKDKVSDIIFHSLPNQELFATIDDDRGLPGSSLISRGLYPKRHGKEKNIYLITKESINILENSFSMSWKQKIEKKISKDIKLIILYPLVLLKRILYTLNL
jgi:hypothetical protein